MSLFEFTPAAARLWRDLGPAARDAITSSVWCGQCRTAVTIVDFGGEEKGGGLLLSGTCGTCGQPVARYVEADETREHSTDRADLAAGAAMLPPSSKKGPTPLQGQYLAFIHYYSKLNGCPPAEADMQRYFRVSPPSVHNMIIALERAGWIAKVPGQARSIRLLVGRDRIPDLE